MNIAVFSRSTTRHFTSGGMESHLKNLVEGLAESGHKITVITTSFPDPEKKKVLSENIQINENGIDYFYIGGTTPGLNPLNKWEMIFSKLGFLKRGVEGSADYFTESVHVFEELNKTANFDRVISQSTATYGLTCPCSDNACAKVPPIFAVIHGTIKNEIKNRKMTLNTFKNIVRFYLVDMPKWAWEKRNKNRVFFSRCTKIIAVSDGLSKDFTEDYPEFFSKIVVINNGVDTNIFKPGFSKYSYFTVLYVGRLEHEKGIDLLIKSVKSLQHMNIPVHAKIIGAGVHEGELKELAKNLHVLDTYVEFVGQVKNENLAEYYQQSHVFALPTRREEGHPVTLSEAFCSGLPVLCTRKGGLAALLADGSDGLFVDDNVESLTAKIKYLYENRDILTRMSEAAAVRGSENFSKKAMIEKYNNVLFN